MSRGPRSDSLRPDLNAMPRRRWRILQRISEARFLRGLEFNRSGSVLCVNDFVSLSLLTSHNPFRFSQLTIH